MIKPYPGELKLPPSQQPEQPPTEARLRLMCRNNSEGGLTDLLWKEINKWKLPYTVEFNLEAENPEERCFLKPTLTPGEIHLKSFITIDDDMNRMKDDARKMTRGNDAVLVTGETGTGKELIAKSMIGSRSGMLKVVNCAGLPSELIESELFGHAQGAFTGANKQKIGLMTAAKDGVMFLDEIGELPLSVQGKLLRALQEKTVRPVGSNDELPINCKFVCATNRSLKKMVEEGEFRRDLYARISTLELHITSLKERKCDIIPIIESLPNSQKFLDKFRDEVERLDLSNNVRSLEAYVIRYNVLGRLI